MNLQTSGKRIVMPEGVRELLDERTSALEKQKEELKPHAQWVRDWEDSRGQDGSAPSRRSHGGRLGYGTLYGDYSGYSYQSS